MIETEYIIDLSPDGQNRYRHSHCSEGKTIVKFRVQYEAFIEGAWHAIVRYDSAHGFAHRDLIHPDGTETKISLRRLDFASALTHGERDLKLGILSKEIRGQVTQQQAVIKC